MRGTLIATAALVVLSSTAHAQIELKNDSFTGVGMTVATGGFSPTEIGAVRFVAPAPGRQLLRVELLWHDGMLATAGAQEDITFKVWDDTAGGLTPGVELYSDDFTLTESDSALNSIVPQTAVTLTQQFRVGIVFKAGHLFFPSLVRDTDGFMADKNYIFATDGSWHRAQDPGFGVLGDWIVRAFVSNGVGPQPDAAPGAPDASPGPDADPTAPDAAGGGMCAGNTECPIGQYCSPTTMACTFDCREDPDCSGGDTCNSLGQCVEGGGGGCGCATESGGGTPAGGVLFGLGVLALIVRRRR